MNMFNKLIITYLMLIIVVGCTKVNKNNLNQTGMTKSYTHQVDSLLKIMTLEEKIGQMNQYNGFWDVTGPTPKGGDAAKKYEHLKKGWVGSMLNVNGTEEVRKVQKIVVEESRLGIPLIIGYDVIHGYETMAPIPLAESASWDMESIKHSAQIAAAEASAVGVNWTFAPMMDISRDARWGRIMEGGGEDPYLGSRIAAARVKGFQGEDLSSTHTVAACAKHFAGYGFIEAGREYNKADIGTSTLYNIVLPPFKAAVDAGVKTFMNSFNELNGVPATASKFLQRDILKGKWGFDGFVVSDWGSIGEIVIWGNAIDKNQASELAVKAGCDMDMESYAYVEELAKLVKEGKVEESLIDDAVRRILTVKYELGLFDDPYKYCNAEREKEMLGNPKHHDGVLEMAKKSIVLLKNDKQILPLKKNGQKIVLIGALAADKDSPLGSWRAKAKKNSAVSVLEGMKKYNGNNLIYKKGADVVVGESLFVHELKINETDKSGFPEAIRAAKSADVVVMVLGEIGFQTGEARSRTRLGLPGVQQELLEKVYQVNKNIVLVLNNGRPLTITWADEHIPAIVEAWHLGSEAGNAIAQVLYGDYNPGGKLPVTFPRSVGQVPIYYNHKNTGRPHGYENDDKMVFWSHYSDESNDPLYPFGYGLSYTTFKYSNLKVEGSDFKIGDKIKVTVKLTNTGKYDGREVVQLYIRDLVASITRPVRELKGFELADLKAGESKTIEFILDKEKLGFYDNEGKFIVEPGEFEVFVGGDSKNTLNSKFMLK